MKVPSPDKKSSWDIPENLDANPSRMSYYATLHTPQKRSEPEMLATPIVPVIEDQPRPAPLPDHLDLKFNMNQSTLRHMPAAHDTVAHPFAGSFLPPKHKFDRSPQRTVEASLAAFNQTSCLPPAEDQTEFYIPDSEISRGMHPPPVKSYSYDEVEDESENTDEDEHRHFKRQHTYTFEPESPQQPRPSVHSDSVLSMRDEGFTAPATFPLRTHESGHKNWVESCYMKRSEEELFQNVVQQMAAKDVKDHKQAAQSYELLCHERCEANGAHLIELKNEGAPASQLSAYSAATTLFRMERNTWKLVNQLYKRDRISRRVTGADKYNYFVDSRAKPSGRPGSCLQEAAHVVNNDPELKKAALLVEGQNMGSKQVPSSLDPDADVRDGVQWHANDQESEMRFLEALWTLIRAGRIKEAAKHAIRVGQPWRAASIEGGTLHHHSNIYGEADLESDVAGNPRHDLWVSTCRSLADSEELPKLERAIYAALSGYAKPALDVCKSWTDQLWVLLRAHYQQRLSEVVREATSSSHATQIGTAPTSEDILEGVVRDPLLSIEDCLNFLAESGSEAVKAQSLSVFPQLQSALMKGDIGTAVCVLAAWARPKGSDGLSMCPSQCLRFATHLIMFLRESGEDIDKLAMESLSKQQPHSSVVEALTRLELLPSDVVITSYISHLLAWSKFNLVPCYISEVSVDLQPSTINQLFKSLVSEPNEVVEQVRYLLVLEGLHLPEENEENIHESQFTLDNTNATSAIEEYQKHHSTKPATSHPLYEEWHHRSIQLATVAEETLHFIAQHCLKVLRTGSIRNHVLDTSAQAEDRFEYLRSESLPRHAFSLIDMLISVGRPDRAFAVVNIISDPFYAVYETMSPRDFTAILGLLRKASIDCMASGKDCFGFPM